MLFFTPLPGWKVGFSLSRHISQKSIPVQQGMLDETATLHWGFVVKQAQKCQTWPKEKKGTFFFPQTQLFSAAINPLHRRLSETHTAARTQLQAEHLHQVTPEPHSHPAGHAALYQEGWVASLHFFPLEVNPVQKSYTQSDWQWQMTYFKEILFVYFQSRMLLIIHHFCLTCSPVLPSSLDTPLTTSFAAERCRMLPLGYDEDLYSLS